MDWMRGIRRGVLGSLASPNHVRWGAISILSGALNPILTRTQRGSMRGLARADVLTALEAEFGSAGQGGLHALALTLRTPAEYAGQPGRSAD